MYATIDIETTGLNRYKDKVTWIGIGLAKTLDDDIHRLYTLDASKQSHIDKFFDIVQKLKENKVKTVFQNGKFDTLFHGDI